MFWEVFDLQLPPAKPYKFLALLDGFTRNRGACQVKTPQSTSRPRALSGYC